MGMIGFYAGSFDPFTNGHLAIVKKATKCFDEVIIGIGNNAEKKVRVDKYKMKDAIEKTLKGEKIDNARVIIYDGLTAKVAKQEGAEMLIRGLRNRNRLSIWRTNSRNKWWIFKVRYLLL